MKSSASIKNQFTLRNGLEKFNFDVTAERIDTILHARGLARLESFIDHAFERCLDETSELALLQRINDILSDRATMQLIVKETENDPSRMVWIAQQSSRNPNGFYRLMLLGGRWFKCRAHIWTDAKFGIEAIHDHKCHFASRVLKGGYTNINYRAASDGNGIQMRNHLVSATDESRQARSGGEVGVILDGITEFRERSSFVMPSHQLHSLNSVKPFSMTFTTRGRVRPKMCRILLDGHTPIERPQIGLSDDTVAQLLYQLKAQYIFDQCD